MKLHVQSLAKTCKNMQDRAHLFVAEAVVAVVDAFAGRKKKGVVVVPVIFNPISTKTPKKAVGKRIQAMVSCDRSSRRWAPTDAMRPTAVGADPLDASIALSPIINAPRFP